MTPNLPIRIATRASQLALWQAEWVGARLQEAGAEIEIVKVSTEGDRRDKQEITSLTAYTPGGGVFTKEIQAAVAAGRADLAVHSFKDLPTEPAPGMFFAAVCEREDPADVLVTRAAASLDGLPPRARVGTGSLRRRAQLLRARPDLVVADIRGNVDTRLAKLDRGDFDAIVLAAAGLVRLGYAERIAQRLSPDPLLPAVGQGALAVECREDDRPLQVTLAHLDHLPTRLATRVERTLLARLRAGCLAPVAAWAECCDAMVWLRAAVFSKDGQSRLSFEGVAPADQGERLAQMAADRLLEDGAQRLIAECRR
jgi:hydroxymethylbilane synthase